MDYLIAMVAGYVCGSIPFGLILSKGAGLGDVRKIGSGNIGATNVLRTGNRKIAALTLVCDVLKGVIPVALCQLYLGLVPALVAGLGALLGHMFPVWLGFKGGKGVATFIGVLFGLFWPMGLIFLASWLVIAVLFRISSLAALVATACMPIWAIILGHSALALPLVALAALIWFMHRPNIARLLAGTESRIDLARKA